ncbi:HD domain protein [uncultured archaeon]|nr:HD domain protein [uncultured archaeon]
MNIRPALAIPTKEIEEYVKNKTTKIELATHDFYHLKLTAIGARWFVKVLGGDKREQELAYIAGLLHDIVRPSTEKLDHAKESSRASEKILLSFNVKKEDIKKICEAIGSHRAKHPWKTPLHQSVFLADKILEQMGAYIAFRRSMYVAECKDYNKFEDIETHFETRIKKFAPDEFPEHFSKLAKTQFEWSVKFSGAFRKKEAWALSIAKELYNNGKMHAKSIEKAVEDYKPISEEDRKYKQEALDYINGKKFIEFETMVKI